MKLYPSTFTVGSTLLFFTLLQSVSSIFSPAIKASSYDGAPELIYFEDSHNIAYLDKGSGSLYFSKNAGEDFQIVDTNGVKIKYLVQHPHKNDYAYAISDDLTHFKTTSSGSSWAKFTTQEKPALDSIESLESNHSPIVFHGQKADYALFAGQCGSDSDEGCERQYYYTRDNFDEIRTLTKAYSCLFSDATPNLNAQDSNSVTCIVSGEADIKTVLAKSSDWFGTKSYVSFKGGLVTDIQKLGAGSHSLIAVGSHLSDRNSINVYVSYDGNDWDKVEFPVGSELSQTFSIVEGTEHSIFVDVKYSSASNIGQLFYSSGANGSYFIKSLDYTHRDNNDNVDYELVTNVDGVVLANTVANGAEVLKNSGTSLKIQSKISFDQGINWVDLKENSGSSLHLHSLVERAKLYPDSPGKYFSSPVPGILLGVGNTGDYLKSYEEGDTFISLDSGLTWEKTLNGPHLFEFGDQGTVIVAIEDGADTNSAKYTINQGKSWQTISLEDTIRPKLLTTVPDSTNFKFLVSGQLNSGSYKTYFLNFDNLYGTKCSDSDYENWYVKGSESSEPLCILGHKQSFKRRLREANCFVGAEFKESLATESSCDCTENDFVCSLNFKKDSEGTCVPAIQSLTDEFLQSQQCSNNADTYTIPSAYTLKPGSQCQISSGINLIKTVEKRCPSFVDTKTPSESLGSKLINYDEDDTPDETEPDTNPDEKEGDKKDSKERENDGRVKTSSFAFGGKITKYVYLDRVKGSNLKDETIILLTTLNKAFVTHDQGSSWEQVAPGEEIIDIYVNPHNTNHVYLLSVNQKFIYSTDRADNWKSFRTPANYIPGVQPLRFHPKHSNWLIYIGQLGCDSASHQGACRTVAYRSQSYGKRFQPLQENVKVCEYLGHLLEPTDEKLIVCQREENEHTVHASELYFSEDYFETSHTPFDNVIGYAQADDYLVAATAESDGSLKAHVSINGKDWSDALFPSNFKVVKQQAYTVLSAQSHAIFLHVTTNPRDGAEFGAILKSNSNGTSYVLSSQFVNRNSAGFVDFEQLENLEGVAVINTVSNPEEAKRGAKKRLQTKITHNDGADWDFVHPPGADSDGKKYECKGKSLPECSLHLHGYTERSDYRDTFSSGSAIGMMVAVGNVGDKLESYLDGSTFLTRDGGVTWKEVKKGVYQWEYGDQGSIIVLVNGQDSTNTISYSLDEGDSWNDYKFSEELVNVLDISTVPSDDSRKFLLFTKLPASSGDKSTVYQIDFSQLLKRKCNLDLTHPDTDDFDLWTPKHPHQSDNCLFGHQAEYYRKLPGKDCYIGEKLDKPYQIIRDCACTRQDFECDFNYYRDQNGECRLVPGYSPPDHSLVCKEFGADEYWLPTGYRRIPLTTCKGGHEFDKLEPIACPGKEEEFRRHHRGLTGFPLFLVIVIPIIGAAVLVYVIYNHYVGRYGQIKLGEEEVEFDNSSKLNKFYSIVGYAVVSSINLIQETTKTVTDFFKARILKRSVTLDEQSYAYVPESDVNTLATTEEDDILDDGDLTEAEDDRLE